MQVWTDSSRLGWAPVVNCYEHDNEHLCCGKAGNFLTKWANVSDIVQF